MRTVVACSLLLAAVRPAWAEDARPLPPAPRDHHIRIDGWNLRLIPAQTEPEPSRIAPKPEPAPAPEPVPSLPHLETPACLEAFTHRLRHASAAEAAEQISRTLRQRHKLAAAGRGLVVESKVVLVPDVASNSLIVVTTPELAAEVHELIGEADAPPKQFVVKARVTQVGPDGRRTTVGSPTVKTVEGRPVAIMSAGPDGQGFELELVVEESTGDDAPAVKATSAEDREPEPNDWIEVTVPPRKAPPAKAGAGRQVEAALESKVSFDVRRMPLQELARQIAVTHRINVVLDKRGLSRAGVDPDHKINMDVRDETLGAALAKALAGAGLAFTVQDEVLAITTPDLAGPSVTRTYAVADLVAAEPTAGEADLKALARRIERTVARRSWSSAGGAGTIHPVAAASCLVVRQLPRVHEEIAALLESLRNPPARQDEDEADAGEARTRDAERGIESRLSEPVSLRFDRVPLEQAIRQIARDAGINVVLDRQGLSEAGVTPDVVISFDMRDVSLRGALRHLFRPMGLGCVVEDEVLKVTSRERSLGEFSARIYSVADLVAARDGRHGPEAYEDLSRAIQSGVQPESWQASGGRGTVRHLESAQSLVIRQSGSAHAEIQDLLASLRGACDAQEQAQAKPRVERRVWMPKSPIVALALKSCDGKGCLAVESAGAPRASAAAPLQALNPLLGLIVHNAVLAAEEAAQ